VPTEEQLLNTIFDDGTSGSEKATAVEALKKITCKDRAGLVQKYTSGAGSSSSSTFDDFCRILNLEATISALQDRLEQERKSHADVTEAMGQVVEEWKAKLGQFEHLARLLATAMLDARWIDPRDRAKLEKGAKARPDYFDGVDELITMVRWRDACCV
jgi:hypothetical protein